MCQWPLRLLVGSFLFLIGFSLQAVTPQVRIAPSPSWVSEQVVQRGADTSSEGAGSYSYLLIDKQLHVARQEVFYHQAIDIHTSEGVQEMARVSTNFEPSYQRLTFHYIRLVRDGRVIDKLQPDAIQTIRRESNMDRYLYDGSLTAFLDLSDVRVGDIVEYAFTRKGFNPLHGRQFFSEIYLGLRPPLAHLHASIRFPARVKVDIKCLQGAAKPEETIAGGDRLLRWNLEDVPAYYPEDNLPYWFDPYPRVQVSSYPDWKSVVDWALPLYEISPQDTRAVKTVADSIFSGKSTEAAVRATIEFVQDEIRYLGLEGGLSAFQPHAPAQVCRQRFGDCKDKSLLLVAMLRSQGIEAAPMLVNTAYTYSLRDHLPAPQAFDHCVVQVQLDEETYYVDATINNQGGRLGQRYFPDYAYGLVISPGQDDLIELPTPQAGRVEVYETFQVDSIGGGARYLVETYYRGSEADDQRSDFSQRSLEEVSQGYVNYYQNQFPSLSAIDLPTVEDMRESSLFVVKEAYQIEDFWYHDGEDSGTIMVDIYPTQLINMVDYEEVVDRKLPFRTIGPQAIQVATRVEMPEAWSADELHTDIAGDGYRYLCHVESHQEKILIRYEYEIRPSFIPASSAETFLRDHRAIYEDTGYYLSYTYPEAIRNDLQAILTPVAIVSLIFGMIWLSHRYRGRTRL